MNVTLAAMRLLATLLTLAVVLPALAQDQAIRFSKTSGGLTLKSYDAETSTHLFEGKVVVTGTIVFQLDMASPTQASGDVNFAKFIPDASSVRKLPAVVSGAFAGPIRYVSLEPADVALRDALGADEAKRVSHGTQSSVSARVKVLIHTYRTGIECDARTYWATIDPKDVAPLGTLVAAAEAPSGC